MSLRKMGLLAVLGILLCAGVLMFFRDHVISTTGAQDEITDLSSLYEAQEEIAAAKEQLQKGAEPAEILTKDTGSHVAIVIDGLPDRTTTARLLDVLKKHDASAVFFVEGQNAANQPETIQLIREAGQEIGNYTFVGIAAAQGLPQDRLLAEICRTQKVVEVLRALRAGPPQGRSGRHRLCGNGVSRKHHRDRHRQARRGRGEGCSCRRSASRRGQAADLGGQIRGRTEKGSRRCSQRT